VNHDQLERTVQSGLATAQELSQFQASTTMLASATSTRQAALDAAYNAGVANLSGAQQATLAAIKANKSWSLPVKYLVASHTQAQWVALRDALANDKISEQLGETKDATAQSLLASEGAAGAVATASSNLGALKASVTSAWNTAVGG